MRTLWVSGLVIDHIKRTAPKNIVNSIVALGQDKYEITLTDEQYRLLQTVAEECYCEIEAAFIIFEKLH
jgi:hypothetical protein